MAKDHFVAQTYLRQWVNPATDKMRGYGKRTGKEFPCATDNVCREWDWDVNPRFGDNPRLMGDFRKIFEPQWRPAVSAARVSQMSIDDRFAIAGYWALLTTCTPSWHRNAVQVANKQIADFIPLAARHLAKEKPEYQEFVEDALAKGKIQPNSDLLDIKAMLTQQLTQTTFLLYQQDWVIIRNDTEAAFITSDNPSSVLPRRPFSQGLVRFLPLAPDLALLTAIDPKLQRAANIDDLAGKPCRHWLLKPDGVRKEHIERLATDMSWSLLENYVRWVANEEAFAQNINDLADEGTGKLLELTVKYKNLEWSFTRAAGSTPGFPTGISKCTSMAGHSCATTTIICRCPKRTRAFCSSCVIIPERSIGGWPAARE
jgi:hypothetical protein